MKRCSASLVVNKCKSKPLYMQQDGYNKKETISSVVKDMEKLELSYIAGGNVNGIATLENILAVPQKDEQTGTIQSSNCTPAYIQEK